MSHRDDRMHSPYGHSPSVITSVSRSTMSQAIVDVESRVIAFNQVCLLLLSLQRTKSISAPSGWFHWMQPWNLPRKSFFSFYKVQNQGLADLVGNYVSKHEVVEMGDAWKYVTVEQVMQASAPGRHPSP